MNNEQKIKNLEGSIELLEEMNSVLAWQLQEAKDTIEALYKATSSEQLARIFEDSEVIAVMKFRQKSEKPNADIASERVFELVSKLLDDKKGH